MSPGPSPGPSPLPSPAGRPARRTTTLWDGAAPPAPWADRADGGAEGAVAAADGTEEAALVYFGLIDVLTKWGARKAAEHVAKAAGAPARRNEISCVPPRQYGARFVRKMQGWLDVQVDVAPGASAHGTPAHGTPATPKRRV